MMRIGILTFHHVHNFGAVLQAWALSATLKQMGYEATVIDYRPVIGHQAPRMGWRRFVPSPGKLQMSAFVRRHIPVSGEQLDTPEMVDAHIDATPYDALICGSDQVWMIYDHQGVDRPYFLGVGSRSGLKRLSYAPSVGSRPSFGPFSEQVSDLIGRFDAVAARDHNTLSALSEIGITTATRVLDPTLIADFSPLLSPRAGAGSIVVVGKTDPAADRYIRFAAQALGCPVRAIGTRTAAADLQRPFASPVSWLNEIAGARLVVTSLFHGAAVSMALRKPFVALDCGGRAFKLEDLCQHLDIPERVILRGEQPDYTQDPALLTMDYGKVGPRLTQRADQSRAYLEAALRG